MGGKTAGFECNEAKKRNREDGLEIVFFHSMPPKFFSELNHRFFIAHVLDISPGPGTYGEVCIAEGVTYVCLAFTEKHADELNNRFKMAALRLMCDESNVMHYNAKCALFFNGKE